MPRDKQLQLRVSASELDAVKGAAEYEGRTQSEFIRDAIRAAVDRSREKWRLRTAERAKAAEENRPPQNWLG